VEADLELAALGDKVSVGVMLKITHIKKVFLKKDKKRLLYCRQKETILSTGKKKLSIPQAK
jgi:hypothetical protein